MLSSRFSITFIRQILFSIILFTSTTLVAQADQRLFRIQGSNTIGAELGPKLVMGYLKEKGGTNIRKTAKQKPNEYVISANLPGIQGIVFVDLAAHGSSTGFRGLLNKTADIAAASRPIKNKEVKALSFLGDMRSLANEHIIAIDGLSVVVHPGNPISMLDTQTIAQLFSGKITNWKQLGGANRKVHLYARDHNSGTWDTFKHLVLGKSYKLSKQAMRFESNDELAKAVAADPGAIGFTGISSTGQAKVLAVSDGGSRSLSPGQLTVSTEDYALSRRLYLYTATEIDSPYIKEFLAFAQSHSGQDIVKQVGFISQNIQAVEPTFDETIPGTFKQLTQAYQRLTLNFRFAKGRTHLDNKAQSDLQRLINYLKTNQVPESNLMLIGYSDKQQNEMRAQMISEVRALSVKTALRKLGINLKAWTGYGQYMPVATSTGKKGIFKNGRVEVWALR